MLNFLQNIVWEKVILSGVFLIWIIILLTFLQRYHYQMLHNIKKRWWKFLTVFVDVVIRIGVILHEFSHLWFAVLFGAKIHKVELFKKTWGQVTFATKDYIANLWFYNWNKVIYLIKLIINRVWIFLSSMGPLLVGIFLNFLLVNYITGNPLLSLQKELFSTNWDIVQNIVWYFDLFLGLPIIFKILLFIVITIFLPSFILSRKDLSHFFFYKWPNIFASAVGSLINFSLFFSFIILATRWIDYIWPFAVLYIIWFLIVLIIFLLIRIALFTTEHIYPHNQNNGFWS